MPLKGTFVLSFHVLSVFLLGCIFLFQISAVPFIYRLPTLLGSRVPAVKLLRKLSVVIEPSSRALTASPAVAFKVCFLPHFEFFRVIFFAFLFHAPILFCSFTGTCFHYMQEICVTFHSFLPLKRLLGLIR
uniref:Transmembrane protein n=1 Tax=Populus davidiana TaxID=266767 RepID=A0A6M2E6T6_9ROSI